MSNLNNSTISIQGFILYKFFYGDQLVYLGRTKQPLQDRIRGHMLKQPMLRAINIDLVTRIEYAEFKTEADMNLYEIYYILTLRPPLNRDDRAGDIPTVTLPDVVWREFHTHLWASWQTKVRTMDARADSLKRLRDYTIMMRSDLRSQRHSGELEADEYYERIDALATEVRRAEENPNYVMSTAQESAFLAQLK